MQGEKRRFYKRQKQREEEKEKHTPRFHPHKRRKLPMSTPWRREDASKEWISREVVEVIGGFASWDPKRDRKDRKWHSPPWAPLLEQLKRCEMPSFEAGSQWVRTALIPDLFAAGNRRDPSAGRMRRMLRLLFFSCAVLRAKEETPWTLPVGLKNEMAVMGLVSCVPWFHDAARRRFFRKHLPSTLLSVLGQEYLCKRIQLYV